MSKNKVGGYMTVCRCDEAPPEFDGLSPIVDPNGPRFMTSHEARARVDSYAAWDRKSDWSIFENSVPAFLKIGGKITFNEAYRTAPWTIILYRNLERWERKAKKLRNAS